MSRLVLDNTVTMAWCFADEATAFTETVPIRLSSLTDSAIVPASWLYEVVKVTGLDGSQRTHYGREGPRISGKPCRSSHRNRRPDQDTVFRFRSGAADQYKLTAYDASWLELAIRHKLPIAALDKELGRAALEAGVTLVQI